MADEASAVNMHFTPTSASWLDMVERFVRHLTTERLRQCEDWGSSLWLRRTLLAPKTLSNWTFC